MPVHVARAEQLRWYSKVFIRSMLLLNEIQGVRHRADVASENGIIFSRNEAAISCIVAAQQAFWNITVNVDI
jgi:hypothetical protein